MTRVWFIFIVLLFIPALADAQGGDPLEAYAPPAMFGDEPPKPVVFKKSPKAISRSALPKSQILAPARFSDYNQSRRIESLIRVDVPLPKIKPRSIQSIPPALTSNDLGGSHKDVLDMSIDTTHIIAPRITEKKVNKAPAPAPIVEDDLKAINAKDVLAKLSIEKIIPAAVTEKVLALDTSVIYYSKDELELDDAAKAHIDAAVLETLRGSNKSVLLTSYATPDSGFSNAQRHSDKHRSLMRAVHIRDYVANQGIETSRVRIKPMGANTETFPKNRVEFSFSQ